MAVNEFSPKIVELPNDDDSMSDEYDDCEPDPDEVQLKFKQSFLKNRSTFEKQLLDSTEIDPTEIFDFKMPQEVEGDAKKLCNLMDAQILDCVINCDDEDENKLQKLSCQMTPLPGVEGVFKKLTSAGEGPCPLEGSIVTVHYNGYVQDEISHQVKSYDSTVLRGKPVTFMRGTGEVIIGLDIAIGSMKRREQAEFIITPELAFGEMGCPPRIPANSYVYYKVDLIEWVDSSAAEAFGKLPLKVRKEMPFEKVLEAAQSEKRKANAFFEKQNYYAAIACYRNALRWILDRSYADEEEEKLGQDFCLIVNLDLALVYLRVNKPKKTCIYCRDALYIKKDHPKALYRFGIAQEKLGDFNAAKSYLLRAKNVCPNDPNIARALSNLSAVMQKEEYVEKQLALKMLGLSTTAIGTKPPVPTEASHIAIRRQLMEFVENSKEERLTFPQGVTQQERKFLEAEANRLNLKFATKPMITGDTVCTVSKQR